MDLILITPLFISHHMHYEYQHAGLERSQPSSSEQNFIKGMDIRAALDRSGFGDKGNTEKSQMNNGLQKVNSSGSVLKSSELKGNRGIQSKEPYQSNLSGYNGVRNSGFKQSNLQDSGFGQSKRQESGIRNSGFGREENYDKLERSEVRQYDQSDMRNKEQYGAIKGSEFRRPNNSEYKGDMQGSSFAADNSYEYGEDTRNRYKSAYYEDPNSRNQEYFMSSMKPSNMNQASSFQYSQSGRREENSSFKNSSSLNKPNSKREGVENILESFSSEGGYYKTIDIINFMAHYSMAEDSPQDNFLMHQLHRNMKNNFKEEYIPSQLEELGTKGRYWGSESVQQQQRKVLYQIYLQYLKENGREFQLSSQQKAEQFQKVLRNMRPG